jgi:signal transduction histidine kinase
MSALPRYAVGLKGEWRRVAVSLVLLALLAVLATLQYRWIGSTSQAERGRLQAGAQARAIQMAQEVDAEISKAYFTFYQMALQPKTADPARFASTQYARWLETAKHPGLIRGVFLVTLGETTPQLRRVIPGKGAEPAEWPPEFAEWNRQFKSNAGLQQPALRSFVIGEIPAFFVTMASINMSDPSSSKFTFSGSFSGLLLGWLDREYLRTELLPAVAARFFSTRDGFDYHVAVVSPKEKDGFVYVSEPGLTRQTFASPDVKTTLLQVRLEQMVQSVTGARAVSPPFRSDPNAGEWQLLLVHRTGSLDNAIALVRRRNLAVSFGVVLLIAASIALMVVSTRRAERLARQQMEFVAGVSHELRTPLSVIRSAGENLSDGVIADPGQVQRYGALIAEEGRRLTEMVEQVMSFAGFDSGHDHWDHGPVVMASLVEEAAAGSRIEETGFTLERQVAPDLPTVDGNARALQQAIENLLSNAAKYGGPDRWVRISADRASERPELRVTVEDHGRGIRPDEQRRIFEPFYRSRDVMGSSTRGSGLGLSIARRIAEAHGGSISVRSTPGQGSAFTLHVPLDTSHDFMTAS